MFKTAHQIRIHALDPTLADVRIEFPDLPDDMEVRGRIMGPHCPGVSTIEVAYLLRAVGPGKIYQVLIPEPTFWKPETPFVYEGPVEFWRGGKKEGETVLSLGLKAESRWVI